MSRSGRCGTGSRGKLRSRNRLRFRLLFRFRRRSGKHRRRQIGLNDSGCRALESSVYRFARPHGLANGHLRGTRRRHNVLLRCKFPSADIVVVSHLYSRTISRSQRFSAYQADKTLMLQRRTNSHCGRVKTVCCAATYVLFRIIPAWAGGQQGTPSAHGNVTTRCILNHGIPFLTGASFTTRFDAR